MSEYEEWEAAVKAVEYAWNRCPPHGASTAAVTRLGLSVSRMLDICYPTPLAPVRALVADPQDESYPMVCGPDGLEPAHPDDLAVIAEFAEMLRDKKSGPQDKEHGA